MLKRKQSDKENGIGPGLTSCSTEIRQCTPQRKVNWSFEDKS